MLLCRNGIQFELLLLVTTAVPFPWPCWYSGTTVPRRICHSALGCRRTRDCRYTGGWWCVPGCRRRARLAVRGWVWPDAPCSRRAADGVVRSWWAPAPAGIPGGRSTQRRPRSCGRQRRSAPASGGPGPGVLPRDLPLQHSDARVSRRLRNKEQNQSASRNIKHVGGLRCRAAAKRDISEVGQQLLNNL